MLDEVALMDQFPQIKGQNPRVAKHVASLVDVPASAVHEAGVGVLLQRVHSDPNRVRSEHVVAVEPADDVTLGKPEALIDRVRLAAIFP